MTEPDENDDDDIMNRIQLYSNDDKKLKFLGQVLSNDTSRKILQTLFDRELTPSEISFDTGFSLPLINHHVTTMLQSGLVTISKTTMNSKNQPMKHYSAKSGIIILPEKVSAKAKQSRSFTNSLKSIMKFAAIGISGIMAWFSTSSFQEQNDYQDWGPSGVNSDQIILPSIAAGIVIIVLYWIIIKKKKRN